MMEATAEIKMKDSVPAFLDREVFVRSGQCRIKATIRIRESF
ncbi:hypothetical protein [Burkholderia cepacia]|nr:hypothetical protein [Burkholderia cepacia]